MLPPDFTTPEVPNLAHRFRQASQIIAFLVAALGLAVLCGWAFSIPTPTYVRSTSQPMKVNTALSFLLLGVGLWLAHDDKRQRSRRILGFLVLVIVGATLAEYAFHVSLGIDQLLFRDTRTPSLSAYPGRMAIATAICLGLLGLAVTLSGMKKAIALRHTLVASCLAFSLVALCGYLYGVKPLYSITSFSTMSLPTSAGLFAVCLAYFLAHTDEGIVSIAVSDSNSGFLLRMLIPAIMGVPILIGWLRLAGQQANLYDTPFGVALMVLGSIGCLTAITLLIVRSVHGLELEQSRANETVRESEQRFRLVADSTPALIWMSGIDKLCTYFNKTWLDFTGRSMEQELGNGWAEGVHPDDLQRCLDTYTQSFDQREKFRMEYRLRHHDGEYRWILDVGVPRFNQDGWFAGYIGVGVDISERKMAEQRLRDNEEQFRTLAEAIPQLCWMARGDGYIFWYNQRWYTYTGTTPDQMEGWGWQSVHDPQTLPSVLERWKASIATGEPFDMVFPLRGSNGVFRPFLTRIMPIKDTDGRIVRWFGTNTDITELREAQKALQTSEERLRLAQKVAGIGSFERSIRTGVLTWTAEMESMYGLPPGSFPQTRRAFQDLIHPDDRAERIKLSDEALKTGQPSSGEWRVIWPDGSVHWIAGRWQILTDESGEPSRVVGVNMDITERKRAEEALADMSRKLIAAQEQERARIARELHDDISQRLAILAVELDRLQDHPAEFGSHLQELRKQTAELSNDVQALSHELHSSKLEYLGVVKGIRSWCKEFGERRGMQIDFRQDVRGTLPQEIGLCLFRVLQEALHNAAKHSGVKRTEVQLHEESGEINLIVSDSGKGFDVEAARKGRGLGLTSMQERVRLVKGTIDIESKPLRGTTIHVRVPLESNQAQRAAG